MSPQSKRRVLRVHAALVAESGGIVNAIVASSEAIADAVDVTVLVEGPVSPAISARLAAADVTLTRLTGARAARRRQLRDAVAAADLVIIEGAWCRLTPLVVAQARRLGVPYDYVPHGALAAWVRSRYPVKHLKKLAWWSAVEARAVRGARSIVYACEQERIDSAHSFPLMPTRSLVRGHTGSDMGLTSRESLQPDGLAFLTVARLHPAKRLDVVIDAFALILQSEPAARLVVAGAGRAAERGDLLALIRERGLAETVDVLGFVPHDRLPAVYAAATHYVCPGPESFGLAVVEALSANLPVVLGPDVGVAGAVRAGQAGVVAASSSARALADAALSAARKSWEQHPRALYLRQYSAIVHRNEFLRTAVHP